MEVHEIWQGFATTASSALGLTLDDEQRERLEHLYALLVEANKTMNLTRITALEDFCSRHLLDSLTLAPFLRDLPADFTLMDVGSGAGFPALPLAIVFPQARITAVESVQKKASFIEQAAKALELGYLTVRADRAETLGQNPAFREQFDVVTARAVSALNVLSELCLPLVKRQGRFLAMKTQSAIETELSEARKAIATLGGRYQRTENLSLSGLPNRALVIIEKVEATPAAYPRHPGMPEKKPLS